MSARVRNPAEAAAEALEALAVDLNGRGLEARIEECGPVLLLAVFHPEASRLAERIAVAADADKSWWFWWSWKERLAPVDDVESAAARIAQRGGVGSEADEWPGSP